MKSNLKKTKTLPDGEVVIALSEIPMKRSQSCISPQDEGVSNDDDDLIPGIPNEIVYHIAQYLLPRSAGALACVNTSWEAYIPRHMVLCFANVLVSRARHYPAVFDAYGLGNIAVLARETIRGWSLKKKMAMTTRKLAKDIWDNLQGAYEEMYHFPPEDSNREEWLSCTICDKPIRKHSSCGIFTVVQHEPIGGHTTHAISMRFHETCTQHQGVERYLEEQVEKLFARIAVDRYRIARPRGMHMKIDVFRDLVDDRLSMMRKTYVGPDWTEQIALWNFLREYPHQTNTLIY